jgi:hypothetical protein
MDLGEDMLPVEAKSLFPERWPERTPWRVTCRVEHNDADILVTYL